MSITSPAVRPCSLCGTSTTRAFATKVLVSKVTPRTGAASRLRDSRVIDRMVTVTVLTGRRAAQALGFARGIAPHVIALPNKKVRRFIFFTTIEGKYGRDGYPRSRL